MPGPHLQLRGSCGGARRQSLCALLRRGVAPRLPCPPVRWDSERHGEEGFSGSKPFSFQESPRN